MADIQQGSLNLVRDMYAGVNPGERTESQRRAHIKETLRKNPDVLFRVYEEARLHMVFLNPSNPGVWRRKIQDRITSKLSLYMSKKCDETNILKIILYGPQEELQRFCDDFHQLYNEVMKIIQADDDGEDEVEKLRERIRKLEMENRILREVFDVPSNQDGS